MANPCTNQLIISDDAYAQITHLFTQPKEQYESPYLDFERIKPIPNGSSASFEWGVSCRPYNTKIFKDNGINSDKTIIEFQTHWHAPHGAIEALVRQYKFDAELYSFEPSCCYGRVINYEFDDFFKPDTDNVDDWLYISQECDVEKACFKIYGISYAEYTSPF